VSESVDRRDTSADKSYLRVTLQPRLCLTLHITFASHDKTTTTRKTKIMESSMAGLSLDQRKLIVGIDFGTTFSGIAWAETRRVCSLSQPDEEMLTFFSLIINLSLNHGRRVLVRTKE
jgi:hypothetical protein